MRNPKQAAYLFFLSRVSPHKPGRSATARKLAKAERDAKALGYTFEWMEDFGGCPGCDCKSPDCKCSTGEDHETLVCLMYSAKHQHVQSLGGICEPTREYMRVVEAELALEELTATH